MSSSTDKEREILERQRRLAAQLNIPVAEQKKAPPQSTTTYSSTSIKKQPPPPKNPYRTQSSSSSSKPAKSHASFTSGTNNMAIIDLTDDNPKKSTKSETHAIMKSSTGISSTTTTTTSSSSMKRPTLKRPKSTMTTTSTAMGSSATKTTADILAAARAKASTNDPPTSQIHNEPYRYTKQSAPRVNDHDTNSDEVIRKESPKVQRKAIHQLPNGAAKATSSLTLASLVQHVVASTSGEHSDGTIPSSTNAMNHNTNSTIPPYQPDDFWKNLRDWDLPSQYYYETQLQLLQQQQQQQQSDNSGTASLPPHPPPPPNPDKRQLPTLPDTFINARHYIASWAPLCMAECRSQLLQELVTTGSNMTNPILVQVESTHPYHHQSNARRNGNGKDPYDHNNVSSWLEENETAGYLKISCPKQQQGSGTMAFFQNDIVLLVQEPYRDIIRNIGNGMQKPTNNGQNNDVSDGISTNAFLGISLIGHTETTRRELDGLIIKVSKRKWTKYGTKQMYFIKVGSNVTALREFTALCSMMTLPMQSFLLGLHLQKEENRRKLSRNQPIEQLISQMGGVEKLGDGFIQYACKKYRIGT
jgi:hypothetical protein